MIIHIIISVEEVYKVAGVNLNYPVLVLLNILISIMLDVVLLIDNEEMSDLK